MAVAVQKRCGVHHATVEQVLVAFIDEVRYRVVEDRWHCVPIESFGTFALKELPERQHMYGYHGERKMHTLPPKNLMKFCPTKNMRLDVEAGKIDWSRRSWQRHPQDPMIRRRCDMRYRADRRDRIGKGQTTYLTPKKKAALAAATLDTTDGNPQDSAE